ncbi:hypothetical protein B0H14DRAFT_3132679 [Mycena olivaceomarginata]|nr:hypothetical protein B0H14DRAFT_3132679 [Mycena olivaceomarginata]
MSESISSVAAWLKSSLCRHTISIGSTPDEDIGIELRWLSSLRQRSIGLSGDQSPLSSVPQALSTPVSHGVLNWARLLGDPDARKVPWITDDQDKIDACASGVFHLLSATKATLSVDVSHTKRIMPLLVYALWTSWPEFKQQLIDEANSGLCYKNGMNVQNLVYQLREMNRHWRKKFWNKFCEDAESQSPEEKLSSLIVIIHGIHGSTQATEMYDIVRSLKDQHPLDIVAITTPELLHPVSRDNRSIMKIHTLAVSATGMVSYSADPLAFRWFNQNLFLLVLDANSKFPRILDERRAFNGLWADLCGRAARVWERRDDVTRSTLEIVALLYDAAEDRRKILQFLFDVPAVTEDKINVNIDKDNTEIALLLQQLLENRSYKHEITEIPEVEALSVLNLTHQFQILERGLPEHTEIKDKKLLKHRAQRLVNVLADFLQILPEELAVRGINLLNDRPVQYGGFADIYHGQYTNSKGEEVQVALKSDPTRHLILRKFAKEALVWHYLRHPNIVPFIGVDATTFPTPMMAMVSSWMSQGSILKYMGEKSPTSRYAITLLNDVIQGLMYLHSENILHGDLCGRNILIKECRACLTDFGLAASIESDTSIKMKP